MRQIDGPARNPFRPGDAPLVLAGREPIRTEIGDVVRTIGLSWRPVFLEGPRGVGKTSLIDWADEPIAARGLLHVKLEARRNASLFDLLTRWRVANQATLAELGLNDDTSAATEVELAAGPLKVRRSSPRQAPKSATTDIELVVEMLDVLTARDSGLVISVDEAQVGGARLVQDVSSLLTSARNSQWPLNFVVAGLHSIRKLIAPNRRNGGSLGQLERASWLPVSPRLSQDETVFAIVEALHLTGRAWELDDAAALRIFELTAGYPYAVQLLGSEMFDANPDPHRIFDHEVEAASATFSDKLAQSLFASRWRQMPPEERRYVHALATLLAAGGAEVTNAQVAERLGRRPNETTYLRERLLDAGMIVPGSNHRAAEFITPLLGGYVLQAGGELDDN
ncbi:MAG: ATP-binding protein [Ilumatobacteraceae bacterium]